jgi:hypothetical protein
MSGEIDTARRQAKTWRQRNSDGRDTFTGARSFNPPTFTITEVELPKPAADRVTDPDDADDARAERHTHVWDTDLVDPDA